MKMLTLLAVEEQLSYLLLPLSIKLRVGSGDCISSGADVKFPNVKQWNV